MKTKRMLMIVLLLLVGATVQAQDINWFHNNQRQGNHLASNESADPQDGYTRTRLQIGSTSSSATYNNPVRRAEKHSWQQTIYPLSQYHTAGWIDTVWFLCAVKYSSAGLDTSLTLYLGHADTTVALTAMDWVPMEELTQVYHSNEWRAPWTGWVPIVLDTPFFYNGIDELAVVFSHSYTGTHGNGDQYRYNSASNGVCISRGGNDESYATHPGNSSGTRSSILPTARFSMLTSNCPITDNMAATHIGNDSVLVSWHERGSATQWQVEYDWKVETGEWQLLGDTLVDNDTVTLTGLEAEHIYRFRVRPICGMGDTGFYAGNIELSLITPPEPIVYDTFEIDINQGSSMHTDAPIDCYYADWGFEEEFIYTSSQLEQIAGTTILGVQFDYSKPEALYEETFTMRLEEVNDSYFATTNWLHTDSAQLVWTGQVAVADSHWTVIFDTPFAYNGGNLLFNTATNGLTGGNCTNQEGFYSFTTSEYQVLTERANPQHVMTGSRNRFYNLPVARFLYEPNDSICRRPQHVAVDSVWGHGAIIRWDNATGAEQYEWEVFNGQDLVLSGATAADSAIVEGLSASSHYTFMVRTVCNSADSIYSHFTSPVAFATPCGSIRHEDLPYTEDFEAYSPVNQTPAPIDACWTQHGYAASPSYSWIASGKHLCICSANDNQGVFIVTPAFEQPASLRLTFNYRGDPNATLTIGTMTDPNDTNDFVPLHSLNMPSGNTWQLMTLDLTDCSAPLSHIAFRVASTAEGFPSYSYGTVNIDNVDIRMIPTCTPINSITVENIGAYDATLKIVDASSEGATYRVAYADTSFIVASNASTYQYVNLPGLTGTTNYTVMVTKICADGSQHMPVSANFRTACGATALPWSYGFEGLSANYAATSNSRFDVECWTVLNRRAVNEPFVCNDGSTAHPMPHSGSRALVGYCTGQPATVLVLPEFEGQPGQLIMGFWIYRASHYGDPPIATGVEVGVMTDPDDATTFTTVATCAPSEVDAWRYFETTFPGIAEGRIAIRYIPGQEGPLYLDDITVEALPNCLPPSEVTVTEVTDSSATVVVTNLLGASNYRLNIGTDSVDFSGTSYTITGLTPDNDYSVSVRTICDDNSLTTAVSRSFHTPCLPNPLPWGEDFDDLPVADSYLSSPLTCWSHLGTGILRVTDAHELEFYDLSTDRPNIAILPNFEHEIADLEMSIELRCDDFIAMGHADDPQFNIGYLTDPADSTTFVIVATLTPSFCASGNTHVLTATTVTFAGAPAGARIALRHNENMSWNTEWYIDNINVQLAEGCSAPSLVSMSDITDHSATIHISAPGDPDHYRLYLSTTDSIDIEGDSYFLDSLTEATTYTISARTICENGSLTDATSASFTTLCSIISSLPWSEDFDGVVGSNDMYSNTVELTSAFPCWGFGGRGSATIVEDYGSTPNNRLHLNINTHEYRCIASTPVFGDDMGSLELTFNSQPSGINSILDVGYTTSATDTHYFVPVATFVSSDYTVGTTTMEQTEAVVFDNLPSGARIAFRLRQGDANWYIDDVDIHVTPICPRPQGVTAIHIGADTVQLAINDTAEGQTYVVVVSSTDDSITLTTTSTLFTVSGLMSGSEYAVSVSARCGDNTLTDAVECSFRTMCAPLTRDDLPYTVDFEDYPANYNINPIDPCWRFYQAYPEGLIFQTSTAYITANSSVFAGAHSGTKALTLGGGWNGPVHWVLPAVADSLSDIRLSFGYRKSWGSTSHYDYHLDIGVMTDPTDPATFVAVDSITTVDSVYQQYSLDYSHQHPLLGSQAYIALRNHSNAGIMIDDLRIECYADTTHPVQILDLKTSTLKIYPNPAHTTLMIETTVPVTMTMVDINGRTVMEEALTAEHTILNISALPSGTYYVRVTTDTDIESKKVVVY